jgi:hypothetical protein
MLAHTDRSAGMRSSSALPMRDSQAPLRMLTLDQCKARLKALTNGILVHDAG